MNSPFKIFRHFATSILLIILSANILHAAEENRSCSVKEVLKGGMYVYIRCQEKDKDIWLATVSREFRTDEIVRFVDAPPMTDFFSKHLNRVFPEVIFTDLLPAGANIK